MVAVLFSRAERHTTRSLFQPAALRCITVNPWQTRCGMNENLNRRQMRWWMPATLIVLAVGTAAYLRFREITFLEPILIGIGLLTALLLGLWYVFFTGLRGRTRLALLLISAGF